MQLSKTQKLNIAGRLIEITSSPVDRLVNYFSARRGSARLRNRIFQALSGSYIGAQRGRRSMSQWITTSADADADAIYDLPTLRERSRDLIRNAPIATGAIGTALSNVVGTGLKLQSRIDYEYLGLTEEAADEWQNNVEREWRLFSESQECDYARTLNFAGIQSLAFRQALENGDVFVLTPRLARGRTPYNLRLQIIEADRVCNQNRAPDKAGLIAGVEKDERTGAPIRYHIMNQHPDSPYVSSKSGYSWEVLDAFGPKTGLRNVLHLYDMLRPGQTRGIPFLAPVIETLKLLDRYRDAELMAAVVSGLFTVFIQSESRGALDDIDITNGMGDETGAESTDKDLKLGSGAIVGLGKGETISTADPTRPNARFDPFVKSILEQVGSALNIPYEVLIRHFTSSYSASRAALLEAWRFFKTRRTWLVFSLCQPVYEIWLYEAIAGGRIAAPGFFADPLVQKAYANAVWVGDSPGYVDPEKEVGSARERIDGLLSTYDEETALLTGGDFEANMRQRRKEKRMIEQAGVAPVAVAKKSMPLDKEEMPA